MSKKKLEVSELNYQTSSKPGGAKQPVLIIKKQFFLLPGTKIRILDNNHHLLAKAYGLPFRLREKIDIYSDEAMQYKIMVASTSKIIDWNVAFALREANSNKVIGSLRRKGWSSEFVRDSWIIFDKNEKPVAELLEDSAKLGLVRRFLLGLIPQTYHLKTLAGQELLLKQSWNPFFLQYKAYSNNYQKFLKEITEPLLLGVISTIAVIEGRE